MQCTLSAVLLLCGPCSAWTVLRTTHNVHGWALPRARPAACVADSDALAVLGGTLARVADARDPERRRWKNMGGAWVLAPASTPWGTLHFVGGAGFGSAPQLAYDQLLSTVVRRCGVLVIATP